MSNKINLREIEEIEEEEVFEKISHKKPKTGNKHIKTKKRKDDEFSHI